MVQIVEYSLRITPGLILIAIAFILFPRNYLMTKIFLLIFGFILLRDTMTPIGFWNFGVVENVIWLRFIDNPIILIFLAVTSLFVALLINYLNPQLARYLKWFTEEPKLKSFALGLVASCITVLPFIIPYFFSPIETRGGKVAATLLPALFLLAILGNLLEEILFRGYLQGYLQEHFTTAKSILLSGLIFSIGHVFLASTVTDLGPLILIFTLWEGLICAVIYHRYGLIAATATHGITIFILSSGVI